MIAPYKHYPSIVLDCYKFDAVVEAAWSYLAWSGLFPDCLQASLEISVECKGPYDATECRFEAGAKIYFSGIVSSFKGSSLQVL